MEKVIHNRKTVNPIESEAASDPCYFIREAYAERKKKNATYSLRAFARDLGISHPLLSQVLNGRRPLTLKQAHKIAALLQLGAGEQKIFLDQTLFALPENAKISQKIKNARAKQDASLMARNFDVEKYHLISSWYHLAILDLTTTRNFVSDAGWIAERIGITKIEATSAIERMLLLGFLERKNGVLKKTVQHMHWIPENSKAAVRTYHKQNLERGIAELEKTDEEAFKRRSITGNSIAIDSSRIDEAKNFIYEFEKEFAKRFTTGKPDEVFQLNLQFFSTTQTQTTTTKKKDV